MRIGKIEVKRRVWVGLGFAVVVTLAWWSWSRAKPPALARMTPSSQPFVRLAGAGTAPTDQILRERAELLDPTPLFFPTEWNYGQRSLSDKLRRQPEQVFASFGPKITFGDQSLKIYGAETIPVPEKLADALADVLAQGNESPFAGIGRIDVQRPSLTGRAGYLEIRGFKDSKPIMEKELKDVSVPRLDFAPLEFLVVVGSAGVIGEPVLTMGSGWEEVDNFFRSYLVKTFRLGERLNPGRYRVSVGP